MTAILIPSFPIARARAARLLLVGASGLALATPLAANELLFTTNAARPETGQRIDQRGGLTQIALTGGGLVSIVDAAKYRTNADGSIDLYEGAITVAAGSSGEVVVRMPKGVEARVTGAGAAGNFTVRDTGEASGHALTGTVRISGAGAYERFDAGEMWRVAATGKVRQVIANGAQAQPDAGKQGADAAALVVPIGEEAGPVAAVLNGLPLGFGDQLAAAGASSDILAAGRRIEAVAGNPALDTFPSSDFALLVAAAAQLESAYGGTPFPAAQADIIRAYLRFLGGGGAGNTFLASYSRFATDYLDLIRSGGFPSAFAGAGPQDVEAYLAYIRRTGAFTALAARDRVLAEAYLAFLGNGGNRDAFASSFTDLTTAYFGFVRGGGDPGAFTGASEAVLAQTIAFLQGSGLVAQLGAADRALVEAYLANGGLAFAGQYRVALEDYFAFLASGRRPSEYAAIDQTTLRAYLETLANTGLLATVLGERAGFYTDYLAFLRTGGAADSFARLPANIFAGYTVQLDAYFAFLASVRRPSEFMQADIATLQAWVLELQAAGALERFLGDRSAFFAEYAAFVAGGGSFDSFALLPANIFAGYATNLRAFFDFVAAGGVPSGYTLLTPAQIRDYIAALEAAEATGRFLGDLAGFYRDYAVFLAGGGNPDLFAGLPVPPDFPAFAAALNAYAAFLQGGGLPSDYTTQDLAQLRGFIDSLNRAGQLNALLGANAGLLNDYFAFLASGGSPDGFAGLPVYAGYVSALNAYFAFLQGGGLPGDYAALDQATINAYLAALANVQGGLARFANLDGFFTAYAAFVLGGGDPAQFAGLPAYAGYVAELNAYFTFLRGGGLPSAYADLDAATIAAYLAALANVRGGLAAITGLEPFFVEYFAFIADGGDPDLFAGLPGNGTGGGGGTPPTPLPQLTGALFLASFGGGSDTATQATLSVADDGRITDAQIGGRTFPVAGQTGGAYNQRGWEVTAAGRFGNAVAYTSYLDRDSTLGSNFVVNIVGGVPTRVLPQTGLVSYRLVGGAAPTERGVAAGTQGYFTGNLGIAFGGASPRVGLDFTVASNGTTYASGTRGGAADPTNGGLAIDSASRFRGLLSARAIAGTGCTPANACSSYIEGSLFGDGAAYAGLAWFLNDASDTSAIRFISGSAVFGTSGTALPGLGTAPTPGGDGGGGGGGGGTGTTPPPFSGTVSGLTVVSSRFGLPATSIASWTNSTATFDANGNIATYTNSNGSTAGSGQPLADADKEAGSIAGAVAWARFLDAPNAQGPVANTGVHTVLGTPAVNLPTAGTVNYTLIGGTRPTTNEGTAVPGSFSGALAVDFATRLVGIDFNVAIADRAWRLATAGGAANPANGGLRFSGNGLGFFGTPTVTGLNAASCTSGCSGDVQGSFFGAGASHAGAAYRVIDGTFVARGLGVFAAPGAAGTPTPALGAAAAPTSAMLTAAAVTAALPAPVYDWSRWNGGGAMGSRVSTVARAGAGVDSLDTLVPGLTAASGGDAGDRSAAIRQAERLMGGMITFGRSPALEP